RPARPGALARPRRIRRGPGVGAGDCRTRREGVARFSDDRNPPGEARRQSVHRRDAKRPRPSRGAAVRPPRGPRRTGLDAARLARAAAGPRPGPVQFADDPGPAGATAPRPAGWTSRQSTRTLTHVAAPRRIGIAQSTYPWALTCCGRLK